MAWYFFHFPHFETWPFLNRLPKDLRCTFNTFLEYCREKVRKHLNYASNLDELNIRAENSFWDKQCNLLRRKWWKNNQWKPWLSTLRGLVSIFFFLHHVSLTWHTYFKYLIELYIKNYFSTKTESYNPSISSVRLFFYTGCFEINVLKMTVQNDNTCSMYTHIQS